MRFPKDFIRVSGQKVRLGDSKVYIYQYNSGKNKNFMIEVLGRKPWEQSTFTIPGKGDEAMVKAIEMAYSLK